MRMFTTDRVENKGSKYNPFLTYAVVSLCFGMKRTPMSAITKQVRRFVQKYLSLSEHREAPQQWSLN